MHVFSSIFHKSQYTEYTKCKIKNYWLTTRIIGLLLELLAYYYWLYYENDARRHIKTHFRYFVTQ
jgi:hypothetical protein